MYNASKLENMKSLLSLSVVILSLVFGLFSSDPVQAQPNFNKSFNPTTIGPASTSVLTFTIDNSANPNPAEQLAFTDVFPSDLVIADPANVVSSCLKFTYSAVPGSNTFTLIDGIVAGGEICTISINVTGTTPGTHTNTTGDLTSTSGNSGTAIANLTINIGYNCRSCIAK